VKKKILISYFFLWVLCKDSL